MNIIINNINYIKCIYEIKKDDLGKDIQILNNKGYFIKNEEILNKMKVIINGEIKSNILTYKFNKEGLYNIYITSNHLITNMSYMFSGCSSLKEINLSSFNTNQVTNMNRMFYNCSSLKNLICRDEKIRKEINKIVCTSCCNII
jgi:surface protein